MCKAVGELAVADFGAATTGRNDADVVDWGEALSDTASSPTVCFVWSLDVASCARGEDGLLVDAVVLDDALFWLYAHREPAPRSIHGRHGTSRSQRIFLERHCQQETASRILGRLRPAFF